MYGWTGTTLRVNLTNGDISKEPTNMENARNFFGARGLGTKILYDEVDPKVDALSPENKLIFAPGPLTGTFGPSVGRYNVVTKGPLTGMMGELVEMKGKHKVLIRLERFGCAITTVPMSFVERCDP